MIVMMLKIVKLYRMQDENDDDVDWEDADVSDTDDNKGPNNDRKEKYPEPVDNDLENLKANTGMQIEEGSGWKRRAFSIRYFV